MEAKYNARASGPHFEAKGLPGHLRPTGNSASDDTDEVIVSFDAGSQAWGDYLEEMEGFEI